MVNENRAELVRLVGLCGIEMNILEDSLGHISRTLQGPLSIKQCRHFLPWKRGKSLIEDLQNLSRHCAELASMLQEAEAAEAAAEEAEAAEAAAEEAAQGEAKGEPR